PTCGSALVPNSFWPRFSDAVAVVGCGSDDRRMNAANIVVSAAPPVVVSVASSGFELNTQPETAERSLLNSSFDTPCSTLYASPANTSSDLFCAFQPNRVTVPSLPLRLSSPPTPQPLLALLFEARLATRSSSDTPSSRPRPTVGVGMRKMTLLAATALAKSGCASVQPGASVRRAMV